MLFRRRALLAPLIILGAAWLLSVLPTVRIPLQELEWRSLDWRTQYRAIFQAPPDPRFVIALFEDDTETNMVSWPPDRAWHGQFNESLSLRGPAVVAWDVILDASREGEGDKAMAIGTEEAMKRGTRVVIAAATTAEAPLQIPPGTEGPTQPITNIEGSLDALYGDVGGLIPFPELRAVAPYGYADAPRDDSEIVRRVPMLVRVGQAVYPSLSLQTLMNYLGVEAAGVRARLGEAIYLQAKDRLWRIPISADGRYLINYRYDQQLGSQNGGDFLTYTYRELFLRINAHDVEKIPNAPEPPPLEKKIVFVGQVVNGKADAGPTQRGAYAPLVLVHANIVHNILTGDFARRIPDWVVALGAVLFGYFASVLAEKRSVVFMSGLAMLGLVGYIAVCFAAWTVASWWLPLTWPILGFGTLQFYVIGQRVIAEQRAKQEIKGMFGTYVSPEVVERIIKSNEPPKLGGHSEEITAFFSDIEGFSTFSEKLPPDRLVELMNEYLTACTDIIQEEGGTLDKYIGDAIVAMFGAPVAQEDHAYRACVATQRVQLKIGELRAKWKSEGDKWPESIWRTRSRIGLNTGTCIIGNMGSRTRFNYTMMGDDVNLAARMESGAKSWGVYSMCSAATKVACEKHGGDRVVFRSLGRIVVKGRTQPVPIYEIVGLKENITPDTRECLRLFDEGLSAYLARNWDTAAARFNASAVLEVNAPTGSSTATTPSLIFLRLVERYRTEALPDDWNGVFTMQEK